MRFYLYLLLSCCPALSLAQIRISPSQLPVPGDTVFFAVDNLPAGIQAGVPGENLRWDFTTLQAPFTQQTAWSTPSSETPFPAANLQLRLGEETILYFEKRSDGTVFQLGATNQDPLGLGLTGMVEYAKPELYRRTPLDFGDSYEHDFAFSQTIAAEDVPQVLLDELPITPDSFRVSLVGERTDEIDAYGRMVLPGGFFEVLREKRTTVQSVKLEAKLGPFPWQDITDFVITDDFANERVQVDYAFFSDELNEPVAILEMGPGERFVARVTFSVPSVATNVQEVTKLEPGVYAFPNPAIINVRFEFTNLPPGTYELSIMNILGIEVWKDSYFLQGNRTERIDISNLRKGTYLYSLKDARVKIITTKRLVVVRP